MDNWESINTLSIGDVGKSIDIIDGQRLYSGITLSGLELTYELVDERLLFQASNTVSMGRPAVFMLHHLQGTIDIDAQTRWREHRSD